MLYKQELGDWNFLTPMEATLYTLCDQDNSEGKEDPH